MGLTQDFARRKFRGAHSITIVTQEQIATAHSLDGKVDPVKRDTGQSVLRFSRRADMARFLRNSAPRIDTIYRITGQDLSGLDLSGAGLHEVEFDNCNLAGAKLVDATMVRAKIKNCNLRGADFTRANLNSAECRDCDMTGVRFAVRNCMHMEIKWCTNPPATGRGEKHQPVYIHAPRYTGPHKIRGLIRKLA